MRNKHTKALTLTEMVVAMSITALIFAAILPQFRNVNKSWASVKARSQILQNTRVLFERLTFHLKQATAVTALSDPSRRDGFIEFTDHMSKTYRCQVAPDGCVRFGLLGDLHPLAGVVDDLRFLCFSVADPGRPMRPPGKVGLVRIIANVADPGRSQSKRFETAVFLPASTATVTTAVTAAATAESRRNDIFRR